MWPFGNKQEGESVALIDIGSSSVGGALVHIPHQGAPVLCYTLRLPVRHDDPLTLTDRMLRTFTELGERMVCEGAPQLRTVAGSGSISRALVSVSSPWQEARVVTHTIEPGAPFTFTRSLAADTLSKARAPEGRTLTQTVVATFLNGYATQNPYGKKAARAEIVVLSSLLDTGVLEAVTQGLRKLFHTKDITYVGFAELCYAVLRNLYPHEREFVVLSVSGEETDVASVKRRHVVDVGTLPHGTNALRRALHAAGERARGTETSVPTGSPSISHDRNVRFEAETEKAEAEWVGALAALLHDFAIRHALPRTIFLIADEEVRRFLKEALGNASLRALWLSDEPVTVVAVEPAHFAPYLTIQGLAHGDTELALLALYAAR